MDNPFQQALIKVVDFLEKQGLRYAVIGGIANQIWGQARFTYDIDIKLLVPDLDYATMRTTLTNTFQEHARQDLPLNPLIVSVKVRDIIVDFLLTTPGYEEQVINRTIRYKIDELSLWICTAEDLIIQKAIAGRTKDWQDIEGILIEQYKKLDLNYLDDWLKQFADTLDEPDVFTQFQNIFQRITAGLGL